MNTVVVDTGVFVAGVFWRHEPHSCLKAWLQGLFCLVLSKEIFDEYKRVLAEVKMRERFKTDIETWLHVARSSAVWVNRHRLAGRFAATSMTISSLRLRWQGRRALSLPGITT